MSEGLTSLSVEQICRRLSQVRQGEDHLKAELPLENPHNAVLRLHDIARYIGVRKNEVWLWFPQMWRSRHRTMKHAPPKKALPLPLERQRDFSNFFQAWDAGRIVKARVGDEWRIVSRHQNPSPLGPAPGPKADERTIKMVIDRETLGLRLK